MIEKLQQLNKVSIHARVWRATAAAAQDTARGVFQFTPACGGRLQKIVSFPHLFTFCEVDNINIVSFFMSDLTHNP